MSVFDWRLYRKGRRGTPGLIGVDFDVDRVNWVQLDRIDGRSAVLRDVCSFAFRGPLEEFLASRSDLKRHVSQTLHGGRFKGRRIVTQVPPAELRLMVLSYTVDTEKSESEQIVELARERMRDDLADHIVDFVPIRTSGDKQGDRSALVAVTPEEPVLEHLDRLGRAGLEVDALEIAPVAVRRLISTISSLETPESRTEITLVLRMGMQKSELTLISGRRLLLYREIDSGRDSIVEAVAKGLDCDETEARDLVSSFGVGGVDGVADLEASSTMPRIDVGEFCNREDIAGALREIMRPILRILVEQVHKAISYAAFQMRGMSIDKIYVLEGAVRCPGLEGLLAEMLHLPVHAFRPMTGVEGAESLVAAGEDGRLGLALGFAMRGFVDV